MTKIPALEQLDIPEFRRDTSKLENVLWLLRNLGIRNGDKPGYTTAMKALKRLARDMGLR